jgi:hypothetical protein
VHHEQRPLCFIELGEALLDEPQPHLWVFTLCRRWVTMYGGRNGVPLVMFETAAAPTVAHRLQTLFPRNGK